jgi:hypothetical protein
VSLEPSFPEDQVHDGKLPPHYLVVLPISISPLSSEAAGWEQTVDYGWYLFSSWTGAIDGLQEPDLFTAGGGWLWGHRWRLRHHSHLALEGKASGSESGLSLRTHTLVRSMISRTSKELGRQKGPRSPC